MSGPKYSQFEIERERELQLELERQRRLEEERRKIELQNNLERGEKNLQQRGERMIQTLDQLIQEVKEQKLDELLLFSQLMAQKEKTKEKFDSFQIAYDPENIHEMESQLRKLNEFVSDVETDERKLDEFVSQVEEALRIKQGAEKREQMLQELHEAQVSEKQSFDLSGLGYFRENSENGQELLDRARAFLTPYLQYETTPFYEDVKSLYDSIVSIATNKQYDHPYKQNQIELRLKTFSMSKGKYDEILAKLTKERKEYEDLLLSYQSLCKLLEVQQNPQFTSKEQLKEEVERLNKAHIEKQEVDYIVRSVNEVMEKLGYDILATDYMVKKKQNVHHHMYEFGFEQAVNVFVSDNGSILFEVSGIGEGQTEMTSLEKLKVTEAMEAFCSHYVEIKEELKQKGIHLTNENLFPAHERYARKIDLRNKTIVKKRNHAGRKERRRSNSPRHLN